jgi:hypothetical protein
MIPAQLSAGGEMEILQLSETGLPLEDLMSSDCGDAHRRSPVISLSLLRAQRGERGRPDPRVGHDKEGRIEGGGEDQGNVPIGYLERVADAVKVRVLAGIPHEIRLEHQSSEELDIEVSINNDTRQPCRGVGVTAGAVECLDEPPNGFLGPDPRHEALEIAVVRVRLGGIAQAQHEADG